jgi:dTDP-4-amino-4,6-dideoxygalactose transaminase
MSNLLAGLGQSQLADLDRRIKARRAHFEAYTAAFESLQQVTMMPVQAPDEANYWLSCITVAGGARARDGLIAALESEAIEARPIWKPLHLQPVFQNNFCYGGHVAESLFENGLCLPSGSGMKATDRDRVVAVVRQFFGSGKG